METVVFSQGNMEVIFNGTHFYSRVLVDGEYFESQDFNSLERAKKNLGIEPTIKEKNNLIAKFMGMTKGHPSKTELRWEKFWFEKLSSDGNIFESGRRHEYLLFDTEWNWLMQVVEKIEGIVITETDNYFNVTIGSGLYCVVQDDYGEIVEIIASEETKIKTVYTACVEFIEWYNTKN